MKYTVFMDIMEKVVIVRHRSRERTYLNVTDASKMRMIRFLNRSRSLKDKPSDIGQFRFRGKAT